MQPGDVESRLICLVCQKQFSHYTCPRCNLRYCSLSCYRKHSSRCTESFHRDNVLAEMPLLGPSPEARERMVDTLKRFHAQQQLDEDSTTASMDVDDDDDSDDIAGDSDGVAAAEHDDDSRPPSVLSENVLNKLASGEEIKLDDLSPLERKSFLRAVASGELSRMIKPWEPWWLSPYAKSVSLNRDGNLLVQPVKVEDDSRITRDNIRDISDVPPPLESPLPRLNQLTPVQPSPLVKVHLSDILYSYCFTLRLYNGDWYCDTLDSALSCLAVSEVLGEGASPETVAGALNSCVEMVCSPSFKSAGGHKFAMALVDDTAALLQLGRPGVICALSDLYRLFDKAMKDLKKDKHDGVPVKAQASVKHAKKKDTMKASHKSWKNELKQIASACKKVYFYLCWVNEQPDEAFSSLALLIEAEKSFLNETDGSVPGGVQKSGENVTNKGKLVIEEIA